MNKLEELIKEYCPNGVEYKKLGDVADFRAGSSFPQSEQGRKVGQYPFYKVADMNKTQIYMKESDNYVDEDTCKKLKCKPAPIGTIIFPKVGATMGTNKKRILSVEACYDNNIMGLFAKNIDPKFLYYCFSKVNLLDLANGEGAVPSLDIRKMANLQIPLPALPVQREIVRVLDSFTLYSAELTAELTARRKQYEFYRDKLLSHKNDDRNVSIAEICKPTKNIKWKEEQGFYKYIDLSSVDRETHTIQAETIINKDNAPSRAQQIVLKDDILYATTRPTLRRYCIVIDEYDNQICSTGFAVLRPNVEKVLPKYLYYIVSSSAFLDYVEANQEGTSYPAISDSRLKEFRFNLPSMETQSRLVYVLDNFDKICSDLKIGLPAEIEKRQQQYEYYREKLLTFNYDSATILLDRQTGLIRLLQYVYGFVNVVLSNICNSISSGRSNERLNEGTYPVYGSTGIIARTEKCQYERAQILVARVGANAGFVHKAIGKYDVSDNTLIIDIKPNYNLNYVFYYLENLGLNKLAKGGGQPLITASQLKEIVVPIPPTEEQNRIVDILDRFSKICNDISAGLPAEIEARQQQYEYYRDKLLQFNKLS